MIVYVLYSRSLNKYYVGQTNDIDDRLRRHNTGNGKYTETGIPWELIWKVEVLTRAEAMKLENQIKKRGIKRYLEKVRGVA